MLTCQTLDYFSTEGATVTMCRLVIACVRAWLNVSARTTSTDVVLVTINGPSIVLVLVLVMMISFVCDLDHGLTLTQAHACTNVLVLVRAFYVCV